MDAASSLATGITIANVNAHSHSNSNLSTNGETVVTQRRFPLSDANHLSTTAANGLSKAFSQTGNGGVVNRQHVASQTAPDENATNAANASDGTVTPPSPATSGKGGPKKRSKYRHIEAVHSSSHPSCLSHDAAEAPSFLGFRNLMITVLFAGNLRLVIENLQKYGVLICVRCHDIPNNDIVLGAALYFTTPAILFVAYLIELIAARQAEDCLRRFGGNAGGNDSNSGMTKTKTTTNTTNLGSQRRRFQAMWQVIAWTHGLNVTLALVVTSYVVYYHIHHPLIGTLTELHAVIVWLKTASYAFTNRDLRHAFLHPSAATHPDCLAIVPDLYRDCPYPRNVTMRNLVYFWWAPTLVYQPVYPRTDSVRWAFVAKRVAEVVSLSVFIWFCSAQYAAPVLSNSIEVMHTLQWTAIVERLLKLSTVSLVIWLAGFFALFHSFLNALAELLRFADRSFYDDWWNSESFGVYWRTWNKPVYQFFKRHVLSPMIARGWGFETAGIVVFVLSAVLHELLVGVPTHMVIGLAFAGMLSQVGLIKMTKIFENRQSKTARLIGNCVFWVVFTVVGQPSLALLYFYFWQAKFGSISKQSTMEVK